MGSRTLGVQQRDPCRGLDTPLGFQEAEIPRISRHPVYVSDKVVQLVSVTAYSELFPLHVIYEALHRHSNLT